MRPPSARAALALFPFLALAVASCGTLAGLGSGDENLPTGGLAPWRKLARGEVQAPPYVLFDTEGDVENPAPLRLADGRVALYYDDGVAIRRSVSDHGLRFTRGDVVLEADAAWEDGAVVKPSAIDFDGAVFLYYEAGGAVGLARSTDGVAFRKEPEPVFRPARAPSVARYGGAFVMAFAADGSIVLARSDDGLRWTPLDEPAVETPDAGAWAAGGTDDPALLAVQSPAGRPLLRLFFAGRDEGDAGAIGASASDDGASFSLFAENPVLSDDAESAPAAFAIPGGFLLYFSQTRGDRRAIAAAVHPPDLRLRGP